MAAFAFPVTLLCNVAGFELGQRIFAGQHAQAAVTVHRSAGLLSPGVALAVLGGYAALALTAASLRTSRSDA